ncbi:signal peptide peptidase SppA [Pleionea sp. CnH1-48]|uniref:signal peptide peptidase SppA n=1 Tax=Pleionea sp. CnH1-48 TaxID=2954494 RepID=UPI002096B3BE|nr:signal peptide peptidase SppA [Pleionea sp. CnH1-48]
MDKPSSAAGRFFSTLWSGLDITRRVFFNLIFLLILLFILIGIFSGDSKVKVPKGAALVFAPKGAIVEQSKYVDPIQKAMQDSFGNDGVPEENLYDLIEILRNAKDDKRITSLVIYPQSIVSIGPSMMEDLRDAINDFKTSGKKVYAMGDYFSQNQYYIASLADEVYLHPYGGLFIEGYSRVGTYFKSMLEKAKVTVNVFRVGTYKSAVEPYLRDDMSDYAKEANLAYLNDLWGSYKADIATARNIELADFNTFVDNFAGEMSDRDTEWGQVAVNNKLVDGLKTRPQFRDMMIGMVGENEKKTSYKQIHHRDYLKVVKPPVPFVNPKSQKIALIVAKGVIQDGRKKEGAIGGDTVAAKIRKARKDKNVKAIVLRVDSPGGSAFASEVIRQELLEAKAQGLPVIASMGTYAASGGYWISANADQIWARPTTITGSIGIFGMIPTFEKTLDWVGIHRDGVGTTEVAGGIDTGRGISEPVKNIIQVNIEKGYQRFLNIVAEGRGMTPEEVDKIAQGRVWSGAKAKELGLVDELGTLKDAINAAAEKAGIAEAKYDVWKVQRELTKEEQLLQSIFNSSIGEMLTDSDVNASKLSPSLQFLNALQTELETLQSYNDPNHAYVLCNCELK